MNLFWWNNVKRINEKPSSPSRRITFCLYLLYKLLVMITTCLDILIKRISLDRGFTSLGHGGKLLICFFFKFFVTFWYFMFYQCKEKVFLLEKYSQWKGCVFHFVEIFHVEEIQCAICLYLQNSLEFFN